MVLYDTEGSKYIAYRCRRPSLQDIRSRTWEIIKCYIDGHKYDFYFHLPQGKNFYFSMNSQWFKLPIKGKWDNFCNKKLFTEKRNFKGGLKDEKI